MNTRACVGLGSNLGDRTAALDEALTALRAHPGIGQVLSSSYHETAPIGGPAGQGPFLNAAATFETRQTAAELLALLHAIETQAGRVRSQRWGERPLDLDLLLFGDTVLESDTLMLPHPRMAVRRFVLEPLGEVAPDAVEPRTGRSVRSLLENLDRLPRVVALAGWSHSRLAAIQARIPPDWSMAAEEPDGALFDPARHAMPTFLAVPETWRSHRPNSTAGVPMPWPAATPVLFLRERDAVDEIRAACLAAGPNPPRQARANHGPGPL